MNKVLKWGLIIVGVIVVLIAISPTDSKKQETGVPKIEQQESHSPLKTVSEESQKIDEYSQKFISINTRTSEVMFERAELMDRWLDWTASDVIKFAATGITIGDLYDEAVEIVPPPVFNSVHQKWVKAIKLNKQSVPLINKGIDNMDAGLLNEGNRLLLEGIDLLGEVTVEIEEIRRGKL